MNGSSMNTSRQLKEFEQELCDGKRNFYRINNSFIVNTDAILRISKQDNSFVTTRSGREISISKLKKEAFFGIFNLR